MREMTSNRVNVVTCMVTRTQPALALMPFDRKAYEFVQEFRIRHAGRLPQFRIHADLREAGDSVDLAQQYLFLPQKEVNARHTGKTQNAHGHVWMCASPDAPE